MILESENEIVVLHCFTYVYDGGQETFIVKTFKYISQSSNRKFRFIICSLVDTNSGPLTDEYAKNKIKLYNLRFYNRNKKVSGVLHNIVELFKLSKIIRKEKVQILYGHDFFSAFIVRLCYIINLFMFYKTERLYISIHNVLFWLSKSHHLINKALSVVTNKIVCVSKSVLEYSLNKDKIKPEKYELIYNGIDVNEFVYDEYNRITLRKEYGIPEHSFVFGTIGSLSFRKGQLFLIDAFKLFIRSNPDSYLLIFGSSRNVDGDKGMKQKIYETISSNGLERKILILEPRVDIHKVYSMFDIFVMPSVVEGFGLVLAEAMSCKCLVIGSDIPSFAEIITPNINGFLFKSESSVDLLRVINHAITLDKSVSERIKENARLEVSKRFNSRVMGQKYAALYEV